MNQAKRKLLHLLSKSEEQQLEKKVEVKLPEKAPTVELPVEIKEVKVEMPQIVVEEPKLEVEEVKTQPVKKQKVKKEVEVEQE